MINSLTLYTAIYLCVYISLQSINQCDKLNYTLAGINSPLLVATKSGSLCDLPTRSRLSFTSVDSLDPRPILGSDLNSELSRIASSDRTGSFEAFRTLPDDLANGGVGIVFRPQSLLSPGKLDPRKSRSMDVLSPTGPPPKGERSSC